MSLVQIDGSIGEGGGQILRSSVSLSAIFGVPIKVTNIRAGRKEPGLRPQHLQAILSAASMCDAALKGASVGSTVLEFSPRVTPPNFERTIDTGTAGSVTLIAQTLIPISIFKSVSMNVDIIGGTEVPNSPTIDYLMNVVQPTYKMLGVDISINLKRRGYFPRGGGRINIMCHPGKKLASEIKLGRGAIGDVKIISACRLLPEHVAARQAKSAEEYLKKRGLAAKISTRLDYIGDSLSPGSSVLVYSDSVECLVGSSSLGERGKRAEQVGEEAAAGFLNEVKCKPSVDSHLADMLSTLLPCIPGQSEFTTPQMTNHLMTNVRVCEAIVKGAQFEISDPPQGHWDDCFRIVVKGARQSEKSN